MKPQAKPVIPTDDAELEGYAPEATLIQKSDYLIRACDGDQEYIWLATRRKKTYRVVEIYPGLTVKETAMREAEEERDLVVSDRAPSIEAVVADLTKRFKSLFDAEPAPAQPAAEQTTTH